MSAFALRRAKVFSQQSAKARHIRFAERALAAPELDGASVSDAMRASQKPATRSEYRAFASRVAPSVKTINENGVCWPLPRKSKKRTRPCSR